MSRLGLCALRLSLAELAAGVREEPPGSNTGPRVRLYLSGCVRAGRPLRLTAGPWCAAAASWAAWEAWRREPGLAEPPHGQRAAVAELVQDARQAGAWHPVGDGYEPQLGDLAVFRRAGGDPTRGGLGHVGRVASVPVEGVYETIDGNHGDRWGRVARSLGDGDLCGWIAYP